MKLHFAFPPMRESVLSNGLRVIRITDHEQPLVMAALQIPVGSLHDPEGLEGTAQLASALMQKGPASCSADEFAQALEQEGASVYADVHEEFTVFGVRMLSRSIGEVFRLFWEMVCNPGLAEDELNRLKREYMTGLQAELSDPGAIAGRKFHSALFGSKDPWGRFAGPRSVKAIRHESVRRFVADHISPKDATLLIGGEYDSDKFYAEWESHLASWNPSSAPSGRVSVDRAGVSSKIIHLIDKPDLSQATLMIGHPTIGEKNPGKLKLSLANYSFGGGHFSSRLMSRIRTSSGKTYGISSQSQFLTNRGIFSISTTTRSEGAGEVLENILEEYREFVKNGITEAELEGAKKFFIGHTAFELEGVGNVMDKILWLRFNERNNEYIENFGELVDGVSTDEVNAFLRNDFACDHFTMIVVGKRRDIEAQLSGIAPVEAVHFRRG